MNGPIRVVGISGSLSRRSHNGALLMAAGELMPAGMQLEVAEIGDLPLYNYDIEKAELSAGVLRLRRQLAAADGLLIATPEYNYTIPAALKNAIEWLSRPLPDLPLNDMPAAIMGVGGRGATTRAQHHLRQIAVSLNMHVLNKPEVIGIDNNTLFDDELNLVDETLRRLVIQQMEAFASWIVRLKPQLENSRAQAGASNIR